MILEMDVDGVGMYTRQNVFQTTRDFVILMLFFQVFDCDENMERGLKVECYVIFFLLKTIFRRISKVL